MKMVGMETDISDKEHPFAIILDEGRLPLKIEEALLLVGGVAQSLRMMGYPADILQAAYDVAGRSQTSKDVDEKIAKARARG